MAVVYILFSPSIQKFYTGSSEYPNEVRLQEHLKKIFPGAFTSQTTDWETFLAIQCNSVSQARRIEKHIKNQKSSRYIRHLAAYPEMIQNLLRRFP
ncbi:MAG: GIY-YIG nuclease family protein [Bacteroidetes bacterium]|uniref:GIY-YIG nuclease family protein n=1 Tax=Phnomibacter sp. TaxID=2836217 RepID=UPI002FDE1771|nr:GIY-YIG nuclease family protein [Bacteroidota bacterium]